MLSRRFSQSEENELPPIRVRIKATGQVLDMVPTVARAMIAGGTAEPVKNDSVETATLAAPISRKKKK